MTIHSVNFRDISRSSIKNVTRDKPQGVYEFAPGLNIVVGGSSSGKSVLIRAIADVLHCSNSHMQKIVWESRSRMTDVSGRYLAGVLVEHDGMPTAYIGDELKHTHTSLEQRRNRVPGARSLLQGKSTIAELVNNDVVVTPVATSDKWTINRYAVHQNFMRALKGNGKRDGNPVLLLDCIDAGEDLLSQSLLWDDIEACDHLQIIVASDSVFSLGIDTANYIELEPGYIDLCRQYLT